MTARWADFSAIRRAFGNRNYAIFTAGNSVSLIGLWVQRLAVGWLAWDLTNSGFWLGAVAFADLFPVVIVGPFAGVLADRLNRVHVSLLCQTLSALQATALCVLTALDMISVELLFALTLFLGTIVGLHQPVRLALVPSLVRREDIAAAVSISSIIFNTARFIGPAVAGIIITTHGIAAAFAVNAASYLAMIFALTRLRLPDEGSRPAARRGIFGQIAEGARYTLDHPGIGPLLLLMAATSILARPVIELLPGLTEVIFGQGAEGLAILTSATGVGAIAGGLWIAKRGGIQGLTRIIVGSALVFGLTLPSFAASPNFAYGIAVMVVAGFVMGVGGISTQTLIQVAAAAHMRGRVLSFYGLVYRGGPAVGALLMGWLSGWIGLRWPLVIGGCIAATVALLMLLRRERIEVALEQPQEAE